MPSFYFGQTKESRKLTMERTSIELITGFTKTGKPTQYQKYLAKPIITLFETIQGSKLGLKLNKAFKGSDFKELTEAKILIT